MELKNIDNKGSDELPQKQLLRVEDVCKLTGWTPSTIYKLTSQRKIKFSKPTGKTIFFKSEDIYDYLTSSPVASHEEIEDQALQYSLKRKAS